MRPSWDDYYLGIAQAVSRRGECVRRQVGAVIVRDHTIVATGYNGFPPGEDKNCLTGDCPRGSSDARPGTGYAETGCRAIHAETNAIIRAGRALCLGATIYVTDDPCVLCSSLIKAAGITRVVVPPPPPPKVEKIYPVREHHSVLQLTLPPRAVCAICREPWPCKTAVSGQ